MSFYSGHKCCKTENISLINIYKRERDRLLRAMFSISVLPGAGKIQSHRGHCYDHASHGHWTSFLGCHEGNCHDYESLGNWSIGKALAIWKVPGCGGHCHDHESLGHLAIWKALVVWKVLSHRDHCCDQDLLGQRAIWVILATFMPMNHWVSWP